MTCTRNIASRIGLLILVGLLASGCNNSLAKESLSSSYMKQFFAALMIYSNNNHKYPDGMDQLKATITSAGMDYNKLMTNPLTDDSPGYEYVKPTPELEAADGIIMYQLRGGKRDMSLAVMFADGSVRKIGE